MEIKSQGNMLWIDNACYSFEHDIKKFIVFSNIIILLFWEKEEVLKNNIVAIDYATRKHWNISDIIKFNYEEAYVSLSKEAGNIISAITYNGVKFYIDIVERKIVKKVITK